MSIQYEKAKEIVRQHETQERIKKDIAIVKANSQLVGHCYKYQNSYGGTNSKWWLYSQIVGTRGTNLICDVYQETIMNGKPYKIEIERREEICYNEPGLGYGYVAIPKKEFIHTRKRLLRKLGIITSDTGDK